MNRGPSAGPENRLALIDAARIEFSTHGSAVPLSRIAQRAGVGQGSLYRHFSDRVDLVTAVFEENLQEVKRRVSESRNPYAVFMDVIAAQASEAAVMLDIISVSGEPRERAAPLRTQLTELVQLVHEKSLEAGELAAHVTRDDLGTAVRMMALTLSKTPPEERTETADRVRRIVDPWFVAAE